MTQTRARDSVLLGRIADRVRDLTEPVTTRQTQWVRSADGLRLEPAVHTVEHPPLVVQLEFAVAGSTAGASSSGGFESRPAANLEPLDALMVMRREVGAWVRIGLREHPGALAVDLARLSSRAHEFDDDDQHALDRDVLRWWVRARIATTWDAAPLKVFVPCTVCGVRGKIRVTLDPLAAACIECESAWDNTTIGILGEHIRLSLELADALVRPRSARRRSPADCAREADRLLVRVAERRAESERAAWLLPGVPGREPDAADLVDMRDLAYALLDLGAPS